MVGATLFNPAVNAVLIPLTQREYGNGGIGAAIALLLTETLVASASMVIFGRGIVGLSTLERVVRMGVACGGMWLTVHLLRGTGSVISLAAGCCALVVLAIVVKAVTPEEQRQIRGFAEKFASKATAAVAGLRARRGDRGLISNRSTRKGPTARPLENGVTVRSDPPTAPREPAPVET
jgi:hypothetical protein